MSAPRAKRQFAGAAADPAQRQITSFFSKAGPSDDIDGTGSARTARQPLLGPVLPSHVQANLLAVGMRVRKSVPEGYKTTYSPSAAKPWAETKAAAVIVPAAAVNAPTKKGSRSGITRELLPFCGINKVGGLATQPELQYDEDDEYEDEDEDEDGNVPSLDDVPEFTISQESADSIDFEFSRKRAFDEEDFQQQQQFGAAREISPLGAHARIIAVPRTRVRGVDVDVSLSQEEDMDLDDADDENDFPEAGFLIFGEGKQMDF